VRPSVRVHEQSWLCECWGGMEGGQEDHLVAYSQNRAGTFVRSGFLISENGPVFGILFTMQ
jgi:hypothetical protein